MATIINNGIISNGNCNHNHLEIDSISYERLYEELKVLENYCDENFTELKKLCQDKDSSKLEEHLKKMKKGTIDLIRSLGLHALQNLIDKLF